MRAIVFEGPRRAAIREFDTPTPGPGEALVESELTAISPGTELRVFTGTQPDMPPFPVIPGYQCLGRVAATGAGCTLAVGTRVFVSGNPHCPLTAQWGTQVSHLLAPEGWLMPVPEGIDARDASMAKVAAIAYHGLRRSQPTPGERVAVVGLGPVGQFAARLHALTAAQVVAFDLVPERVQLAQAAGVDAVCVDADLAASIRGRFPQGVDLVVDATGVAALVPVLVGVLRDVPWDDSIDPRPRYLLQGSYAGTFPLPYQQTFVKEVSFILTRDNQPRDIRAVLSLMANGRLKAGDLVSEIAPATDCQRIYEALRDRQPGLVAAAFQWKAKL